MNRRKTAAPRAKPMPSPSETTFRRSSSAASSSSNRTIALARSATSFTAAPRPCESLSWVGMASPVDPLCEHDPCCERDADDEPRVRAAPAVLRLGALTDLRARRHDSRAAGRLVRRGLAARTCLDQAGLHPAQQVGVLREWLGELRLQAAFAGELVREPLQLVRRALDLLIRRRHFFVGGSSPVSVRQMVAAVRRDTIVAAAPSAP